MVNANLAEAERYLQRLDELLVQRAGAGEKNATLSAISESCITLAALIPDVVVRDRLAELQTYVEVSFSDTAHLTWSRERLSGAQWLRLQIVKTLNALGTRLRTLRTLSPG